MRVQNILIIRLIKQGLKKNYKYEIRNLLESKDLKEYFDPLTSKYKPILVVYAEWEETD